MNILKVSALILFFSPVCIFSQHAVFKEGEFKKWAITPPMGWNSWD